MNPDAPTNPFLDTDGNPIPRTILPEAFRSKGHDFKQLLREGRVALYQLTSDHGRTSLEVVVIQAHDGRIIQGTPVMPAEFMPSTYSWGSLGWSYKDTERERADAKINELCVKFGTRKPTPARRRVPLGWKAAEEAVNDARTQAMESGEAVIVAVQVAHSANP